ncbi:hypothetical protein pb186bvf_003469 [Paramecium bursaria]
MLFILILQQIRYSYQYNASLAQSVFWYTQVSQCQPQQIQNWNCGYFCDQHPNTTNAQSFQNSSHNTSAYCAYNQIENAIILNYRSTSNVQNFVGDLNFIQSNYTKCQGCYIHSGFQDMYQDLSEQMINCTQQLKQKFSDAKVFVVGHSLGGAIAALLASDVKTRLGYSIDIFLTTGAPRVGNVQFRNWFSTNVAPNISYRIVHNQDPVPQLPPLGQNYTHLRQQIWYNSDNSNFTVKLILTQIGLL